MALAHNSDSDRIDLVTPASAPVASSAWVPSLFQDPDRGLRLMSGLLGGTRDHVTIKDLAGRYLYVNAAAAEWFGRPVESVLGRTNDDILSATHAELNRERERRILSDGQPIEFEEVQVRDGITRTWLTTKDAIRDERGEVIALAAISREITARVVAQHAQARSDEALAQYVRLVTRLLAGTTDHISVRDAEGRFLLVNAACATWYESEPDAMIGRTCAELFGSDEAEPIAERDRQLLESGRPMDYEETLTRQGVTRTWLTTKDVIRDDTGRHIGTFAISRDVTELRRAEEQSRQSQKMESIGRLAGGIAHDFNNLLTVISGNAQFLLEDLADHPGQPAAQEIATAADRAATVTRQLLAFSRQQVLTPEVLNIQSIVADIHPLARRLVGADVEIQTRMGEAPGLVRVDRSQLEQVLLNLIINARDAMPIGGMLTITTANVDVGEGDARVHAGITPGPYVELSVADSGTGIDPVVRDRIFEPFVTTKETGKGTGLGLSMVEGVIRQSGGAIWVESEPGVGTTFRVYLPRLSSAGEIRVVQPEPLLDPGGDELILLVEDEPGVRAFARRILHGAGYSVLEARNPESAFAIIAERGEEIDLLLTDVVMPGGTGPDVARRFRSVKADAPVLFMSGYTDDAISHQGVIEPGVTLITKPFGSEQLLATVRAVIAA